MANSEDNCDIIGRIFFKKFKAIKKIGEGSFGKVFQGINIKNKSLVAIKFVNFLTKNLGINK